MEALQRSVEHGIFGYIRMLMRIGDICILHNMMVVSNNHCMLGHLVEWLFNGLGGTGQEEGSLAYKNVAIRLNTLGGIIGLRPLYESPYGLICSL